MVTVHFITEWCWSQTCCLFPLTDVIWVILSVEEGGLLGVTQQLSSFQAEFNTQPHRKLEGDYNPFASPEKSKCPNSNSLDLGSEPQQDRNGLSHNSVDIVANSLQNSLSLVSYNKVRHTRGQMDSSYSLKFKVSKLSFFKEVYMASII